VITVFCWHIVLNCAFASFVFGMPTMLLPRFLDPARALPHRVGVFWWGVMVWALNPFWRIEIEGAERLHQGGPYLVCSNHQSMMDVLVLMALRSDFKWVSGVRFFKIPMLAVYMRLAGYIAADLKNPFSAKGILDECSAWIAKGVSVGLFPEGTRSATGRLGNFKSGAFRVALENDVAVLPVAIDGTAEIMPKGSWTWAGPSPFKTVRVKVLTPVRMDALQDPCSAELSHAVRNAIGDQLVAWRGCAEEEVFGSKGRPNDRGLSRTLLPGADATASA
jgi:1-acyl-sn-glycerol-3-phosphate acyltransferase